MKSPNSGRKKYTGSCDECYTYKTSRWYRKAIKSKVICKKCYDKHRRSIVYINSIRKQQRLDWDVNNPYKSFLNMIKQKNRVTDLTEKEYLELISKPCIYCDRALSKRGIRLDRIDNNLDYLKSNVEPCCKRCNVSKNNMSKEEFIDMCKLVAKNT